MDSLTQIALGSAVAIATLGRRTAVWKAALWGAVAGTLPDLDALIDHGDAILNMVLHRSESHALLYLTALSAPLAWLVSRLHGEGALFTRWWLALWLALITHPLLDWMTVYGTQLLLPFSNTPLAIGSVFIIDPLYTLPLLVGVVAALRHPQGLRWNQAGLVLSTAYLGWSLLAQQHVRGILEEALRAQGLPANQVLVTPAPFSTVLWRAVAMGPEHYHEAYYSLLDGGAPVQWTQHPRGSALRAAHTAHPHVQRLERFSHGFMRVQASPEGRLQITDLRMGLEPCYSFHFDVGPAIPAEGAAAVEGDLPTQQWQRPDLRTGLAWWWQRLSDPSAGPLSRVPGVSSCGR